jgi:hypothetical protein
LDRASNFGAGYNRTPDFGEEPKPDWLQLRTPTLPLW